MDSQLIIAVSGSPTTSVSGVFYRHTSPDRNPLRGSASGGRWGIAGTYEVLYLGRPEDSVIIEAYRHLVDDDDALTGDMVGPRILSTLKVSVTSVLDLREPAAQDATGLTPAALRSDVDEYATCQRVGQVAHQLGMHGLIAPAATGVGDTLALFTEHLPTAEFPVVADQARWEHLPPDPRQQLRAVSDDAETA